MVAFRLAVAASLLASPGFAATSRDVASSHLDATVGTGKAELAGEVPATAPEGPVTVGVLNAAAWTGVSLGGVAPTVFSRALQAAATAVARGDARDPRTLTIVDFSRPSIEKRLWVYDLNTRALLFEELVSHGRNSGDNQATRFSNVPESNQSSLGLFRAAESYIGKHGYSLRLDGLEPGINDRARERAIVIHGATYVNDATAKALGRLGRSLGCPAVRPEISRPLIDAVKEGGLVFAYYPDQAWLDGSTFLN